MYERFFQFAHWGKYNGAADPIDKNILIGQLILIWNPNRLAVAHHKSMGHGHVQFLQIHHYQMNLYSRQFAEKWI